MNRTASRYSTPSGHAAAMSTSEPNSTATPRTDRSRPSHNGPWPESTLDRSATSSFEAVGAVVAPSAVSVVSGVVSVVGVVSTVAASFSTRNDRFPAPLGCPSASLTPQLTVQLPLGSASTTSAASVRRSSLTRRGPTVNSSASHCTAIVLTSPSSSLNVISIVAGDVATDAPSAGVELTTEFSAKTVPGISRMAPSAASATSTSVGT